MATDEPSAGAKDRGPGPDGADDGRRRGLSRRELMSAGGGLLAGAAAGTGVTLLVTDDDDAVDDGAQATTVAPPPNQLRSLTAGQAATLAAALARIIPSDGDGPGADEAMVWRYIDQGLAGELASTQGVYLDGLRTLDVFARRVGDGDFVELSPEQQDEVLASLESGEPPPGGSGAEGGTIGAPEGFFQLLVQHARQGMFGDPAYGGNADFAGWELIGFPGIQLQYSQNQQQIDTEADVEHSSTYSYENFGIGGGA